MEIFFIAFINPPKFILFSHEERDLAFVNDSSKFKGDQNPHHSVELMSDLKSNTILIINETDSLNCLLQYRGDHLKHPLEHLLGGVGIVVISWLFHHFLAHFLRNKK